MTASALIDIYVESFSNAGLRFESHSNWISLVFDELRPCLSSSVLNGGLTQATRWLNLIVDADSHTEEHPAGFLSRLCLANGWNAENTVAMMTAASHKSLRVRFASLENESLLVAVTTGLSNARRAGDPADYRQLTAQPTEIGTINMAVVTSASLSTSVMVEALMIATESKAAVLQELNINSTASVEVATGTGTDAQAIFGGTGVQVEFSGKHTIFAEYLATLTMSALRDSILRRGDIFQSLDASCGEKP